MNNYEEPILPPPKMARNGSRYHYDAVDDYHRDVMAQLRPVPEVIADPIDDFSFDEPPRAPTISPKDDEPEIGEEFKLEEDFKNVEIDDKKQTHEESKPKEDHQGLTPAQQYCNEVVQMPPGISIRAFINDHEKRGSNYGVEMTITGMDIMTLSYQVYKAIDILSRDMGQKESDKLKSHLDVCMDQVKNVSMELINSGQWKPLTLNK